jgi:hypothetical protein
MPCALSPRATTRHTLTAAPAPRARGLAGLVIAGCLIAKGYASLGSSIPDTSLRRRADKCTHAGQNEWPHSAAMCRRRDTSAVRRAQLRRVASRRLACRNSRTVARRGRSPHPLHRSPAADANVADIDLTADVIAQSATDALQALHSAGNDLLLVARLELVAPHKPRRRGADGVRLVSHGHPNPSTEQQAKRHLSQSRGIS